MELERKRDNVHVLHTFALLQGRQGDKGQKGDGGVSSGVDVFSTVKVMKAPKRFLLFAQHSLTSHSPSELIKIPTLANKKIPQFFSLNAFVLKQNYF